MLKINIFGQHFTLNQNVKSKLELKQISDYDWGHKYEIKESLLGVCNYFFDEHGQLNKNQSWWTWKDLPGGQSLRLKDFFSSQFASSKPTKCINFFEAGPYYK